MGINQECLVNSFESYNSSDLNFNVRCPYTFFWGLTPPSDLQPNRLFARMGVNSNGFKTPSVQNLGYGLATAIPNPQSFTGLNFNDPEVTPKAEDIRFVSFRYRTKFCNSPVSADSVGFSIFYSYLNFVNPNNPEGLCSNI